MFNCSVTLLSHYWGTTFCNHEVLNTITICVPSLNAFSMKIACHEDVLPGWTGVTYDKCYNLINLSITRLWPCSKGWVCVYKWDTRTELLIIKPFLFSISGTTFLDLISIHTRLPSTVHTVGPTLFCSHACVFAAGYMQNSTIFPAKRTS